MFYDHLSAHSLLAKLGRVELLESYCTGVDPCSHLCFLSKRVGLLVIIWYPIVESFHLGPQDIPFV